MSSEREPVGSEQRLACPDCKLDLTRVASGSVLAHRCARCRGVWLDPASFRRLCDEESRPPDEDAALLAAPIRTAQRPRPPQEPRIRYRACPACGEVMNRRNFARVSGVIIDVCRAHGAWFDRGELAAIRRFLRDGGLRRYDRVRRLDAESQPPSTSASPGRRGGSVGDLYDVLLGHDGFDVPSRIPRPLVAAAFAALGGWFLWIAFGPSWSYLGTMDELPVLLGATCLWFAWRAFEEWVARRGR